jgi:hypothetical protein
MINYLKVVALSGLSFFAVLMALSYFMSKEEINIELLQESGIKSIVFAFIFGSFRYFITKKQNELNNKNQS